MNHCKYYINRNYDNGMLSVSTEKSVSLDCKTYEQFIMYISFAL